MLNKRDLVIDSSLSLTQSKSRCVCVKVVSIYTVYFVKVL